MMEWIKKNKTTVFFYVATFVILFWRLGWNPLWASEDRWAEIAREMWVTGDWFHPAINGVIYFDKPLLSYWPIALLAVLSGTMNELISRIPSALAAIVALWATRDLAKRIFDERTACYAGWLLLSAYGFLFWSRTAAADVMNVAFIILAVDWFYREKDHASFFSYFVFYLICCAGALAKGFPALILPPAVALMFIITDFCMNSDQRLYEAEPPGTAWMFVVDDSILKKYVCWKNFIPFIPAFLIALIPFVLAAYLPMAEWYSMPDNGLSGLELVWRENVVRVFHPFDHNKEPWCCYFWHVPRMLLPWAPVGIMALIAAIADWKKLSSSHRGLWAAAAVIFVLFTASGSRRWYYILPILPFFAITTAAWITGDGRWNAITAKIFRWFLLAVTGLLFVCVVGISIFLLASGFGFAIQKTCGYSTLIISILILIGAGQCLLRFKHWKGIVSACILLTALVFCEIYPVVGALRTEKDFANHLREYREQNGIPEDHVVFFLKDAPKIVFYNNLRKPYLLAKNPEALQKILEDTHDGKPVLVLADIREKIQTQLQNVLTEEELIHNICIREKQSDGIYVLEKIGLALREKFGKKTKFSESLIRSQEKAEKKKLACWKIQRQPGEIGSTKN